MKPSYSDQCVANLLKNVYSARYLHAVPVALSALLLIFKLEARHANHVEEGLTEDPGGHVVDLLQTRPQPAKGGGGWKIRLLYNRDFFLNFFLLFFLFFLKIFFNLI